MNKFKTFIIGVVFGSLLIGGVGYATDHLHIEVKLPDIQYWYDGKNLALKQSTDGPATIHYKGVNYVPVRRISEALGKEVEWDAKGNRVLIHSNEELKYIEVKPDEITPEITSWLDHSLKRELAQVKIINEETYILLTSGQKNSGGYDINVVGIKQYHHGVKIDIEMLEPQKGEFVTEGVTYPYKLIKLIDTYKGPITFQEKMNDQIPTVSGIDQIPSVFKETENIILFDPVITDEKIKIQGIVNTFEGLIGFSLVNGSGDELESVTIQSLGRKPNWGYFEKEIPRSNLIPNSNISVVLYTIYEKDGIPGETIQIYLNEWNSLKLSQ